MSVSSGLIMTRRTIQLNEVLLALALAAVLTGCVRRTMTIRTEPSGALIYLNDEEVGRSDLTTDFTWYGDYDVVIRKEGYKTLATNWQVPRPWYEIPPIDFFVEVLWPGWIVDAHEREFALEPATPPTTQELLQRALETRRPALRDDEG